MLADPDSRMALLLRLLLVFCLVAPAAPDVAARTHAGPADATADAALPPCHEPAHAAHAGPVTTDPQCCDGLDAGCGCGCGCLHATGLPAAWWPLTSPAPDIGPAGAAGPEAPPPPLTRAERPPIA
jgi:hypothetical protein